MFSDFIGSAFRLQQDFGQYNTFQNWPSLATDTHQLALALIQGCANSVHGTESNAILPHIWQVFMATCDGSAAVVCIHLGHHSPECHIYIL